MIDTAALLSATSIVDLIGDTVRLKKQGAQHYGLCPLHADRSPTLRVDPKKGLWFCPSCQIGGNAIDWLTKTESMDFKSAAAELARRAGIDLAKPADTGANRAALPPRRPKFPPPDREPTTPWGGQHLMAGDGRPVYVLNDFPGRRRYLDLTERHRGVDIVWYPTLHARAAEMYLAPIALSTVTPEPFPGLWEAYRAAELLDAIAGWRNHCRGAVADWVRDHLSIETMRIEGWIEYFMAGREIAPGIDAALLQSEPGRIRTAPSNKAGQGGELDAGPLTGAPAPAVAAPSANETGHAAAA